MDTRAVLVLLASAACVFSASVDPCAPVRQTLLAKNLTGDGLARHNGSNLCGDDSKCCSADEAAALEDSAAGDLRSLLEQHFQSTLGMFASLSDTIKGELKREWSESEKETEGQVSEAGASGLEATKSLYRGLWGYLEGTGPPETLDGPQLSRAVQDFFGALFPGVYLGVVHVGGRSAEPEYEACLARHGAHRFGAVPEGLGRRAASALPRARAALAAARLAADVLSSAAALRPSPACGRALARLAHCPRCLGLPPKLKPCSGYCLNVMRGCLSQNELDLPWYNFLVETERFLKDLLRDHDSSLDSFLRSVPTAVSDALIVARVDGPTIEKEMKRLCGSLKADNTTDRKEPARTTSEAPSPASGDYTKHLRELLSAVESTRARGLYANLPEAICSDESFAETKDTDHCWNGHRIGDYTKALVRPEADSQKYNPEVKWTKPVPDSTVRQLSEQLRHMRKVVVELVSSAKLPASESLVSDEGGSGSGAGPYRPGDDEDDYSWSGSGSGFSSISYEDDVHGRSNSAPARGGGSPDLTNSVVLEDSSTAAPPRTGAAASVIPATLLITIAASLVL